MLFKLRKCFQGIVFLGVQGYFEIRRQKNLLNTVVSKYFYSYFHFGHWNDAVFISAPYIFGNQNDRCNSRLLVSTTWTGHCNWPLHLPLLLQPPDHLHRYFLPVYMHNALATVLWEGWITFASTTLRTKHILRTTCCFAEARKLLEERRLHSLSKTYYHGIVLRKLSL